MEERGEERGERRADEGVGLSIWKLAALLPVRAPRSVFAGN